MGKAQEQDKFRCLASPHFPMECKCSACSILQQTKKKNKTATIIRSSSPIKCARAEANTQHHEVKKKMKKKNNKKTGEQTQKHSRKWQNDLLHSHKFNSIIAFRFVRAGRHGASKQASSSMQRTMKKWNRRCGWRRRADAIPETSQRYRLPEQYFRFARLSSSWGANRIRCHAEEWRGFVGRHSATCTGMINRRNFKYLFLFFIFASNHRRYRKPGTKSGQFLIPTQKLRMECNFVVFLISSSSRRLAVNHVNGIIRRQWPLKGHQNQTNDDTYINLMDSIIICQTAHTMRSIHVCVA